MKLPEIQLTTEVDVSAHTHVIDVRSPVEFAEDHVVGAINLPVLNDEERERVGTMYKQMSALKARRCSHLAQRGGHARGSLGGF